MRKKEFNSEIRKINNSQEKTMRENFKILRHSNNWSIDDLSKISGINKEILLQIEAGEDFDLDCFFDLCQIYQIKPHEMFSRRL